MSETTANQNPNKPWWKRVRLWPQSLAGQLLASLLIALVVAQIVTIFVFAFERSHVALTTTRGQVLERTASLVRVLNQTEDELHRRVIRAAEGPGILYNLRKGTTLTVPLAGTQEAGLTNRLERRAGLEKGTVRISKLERTLFSLRKKENNAFRPKSPPFDEMSKEERREHMRDWREQGGKGRAPNGQTDWRGENSEHRQGGEWRPNRNRRPDLTALDMTIAVPLNNGKWLQVRTGVPLPQAQWGRPFLISLGVTATFHFARRGADGAQADSALART